MLVSFQSDEASLYPPSGDSSIIECMTVYPDPRCSSTLIRALLLVIFSFTEDITSISHCSVVSYCRKSPSLSFHLCILNSSTLFNAIGFAFWESGFVSQSGHVEPEALKGLQTDIDLHEFPESHIGAGDA